MLTEAVINTADWVGTAAGRAGTYDLNIERVRAKRILKTVSQNMLTVMGEQVTPTRASTS